jgi:diacylglycerol kinase family enzyme
MKYILFNNLAGSGDGEMLARSLFPSAEHIDMTKITDYAELFDSMERGDSVVIMGGDGTLNKFVNATYDIDIRPDVYLYPTGTGNDFVRDIEMQDSDEPILINQYIKNLPTVSLNGETYRFVNGVGYGIDGYCCEIGDIEKAKGKKPNYTAIAITGLLFKYKPCDATVTVDGVEYEFKKAWLAPTMYGRFYGGGMNAVPDQKRGSDELSVMLFHGGGRLSTLIAFPGIFEGKHVKNKMVTVLKGKEIKVRFSEPRAVQIDGETVLGVTEYEAKACKTAVLQ